MPQAGYKHHTTSTLKTHFQASNLTAKCLEKKSVSVFKVGMVYLIQHLNKSSGIDKIITITTIKCVPSKTLSKLLLLLCRVCIPSIYKPVHMEQTDAR